MHWKTTRFQIDLSHPKVMGIVNLTPDSFSDGGRYASESAAVAQCRRLLDEGADLLDLGAESSRPGADPISVDEELRRLLPVLDAVVALGTPVSVDTCKAAVMSVSLAHGVDIVNDIRGLQDEGALDAVASHPDCGICLMHMRGMPKSMQTAAVARIPTAVVDEVSDFLRKRVAALTSHGVAADRIVVDPGIGFGKSVAENTELLRRQQELLAIGRPLLVGWSRKSTLGAITGRAVGDRQAASIAAALAAVLGGARILRVHDVAATVDALRVWRAAGLLPG